MAANKRTAGDAAAGPEQAADQASAAAALARRQGQIRLLALFSAAGILVATYLIMLQWQLGNSFYCPIGNCVLVNNTRYAYLFGIPVSVIGLGGYIVLLVLTMLWQAQPDRRRLGLLVALTATPGWLFSAYLTWAEFFAIEAVCFWCLVSFAVITAITAGAWLIWRQPSAPQT